MKHTERRELKDEAVRNIQAISLDILSQTRVPDRVINGSALDAIDWKNNKERR